MIFVKLLPAKITLLRDIIFRPREIPGILVVVFSSLKLPQNFFIYRFVDVPKNRVRKLSLRTK